MNDAMERRGHYHDWDSGTWGVLVGVSRCRTCRAVCTSEDFRAGACNVAIAWATTDAR